MRCLNTNGHLVTPELARALVGLADEVRVSVDALSSRNDALRGAGNFEQAMRALECFYSVGFEPKALVTITATSLPDLEELLCLLIERKITRINLNGFRPIGRGAGHWEWRANTEEVRETVRQAQERCYPDKVAPPEPEEPEAQSNCVEGNYRRWPDAHWPETIEQAAEIDRLCVRVAQLGLILDYRIRQ
ncbi:MAG: hypothetical protein ACREBD_36740 [Blastocatellia bacterium]